jgi:glycosyltransferase involved in cell wall biosynthesis
MNTFDSIICVGQTAWAGEFQKAVVQLMGELAARHRVLYVDYQYTLKDVATGRTDGEPVPIRPLLHRTNALTQHPAPGGGSVWVWQPPVMLPVNFLPPALHDPLAGQNANRLVAGLRAVMRQLNMRRPLIINGLNPVFGLAMLGKLDEWATVYYCFDEISISRWMRRHGARCEARYLPLVDAVVTTSEDLRQTKARLQPRTFCVKNGVNFDLFHQARHLTSPASAQPPTVGYLGTADDRLDYALLRHCAQTLPDVQFEFIGRVPDPELVKTIAALPNVSFLPPRQPDALPPLLARLRAGIIPFVCNDHTRTIYPLKINEYLAAGLPVISTPFANLDDFAGIVALADTPDAFAAAIRQALSDTDPARAQQRVDMARQNSWAQRAVEWEAVIGQLQPRP